jgi:hypothetical protein
LYKIKAAAEGQTPGPLFVAAGLAYGACAEIAGRIIEEALP